MKVTFALLVILGIVICMIYLGDLYGIERKKAIISAVWLMFTGMFGMFVMWFIETGSFGGGSFFGAVFVVPLCMYPLSKVLRIRYGDIMDFCAPAGCIVLAILKFKCHLDGCCYGKLFMSSSYAFRFPSQIVECVVALVLAAVMILIVVRGNHRTMVYPMLLVIYGIVRFCLNLLRETSPWLGPLPKGCIWSILAVIIGAAVLIRHKRQDKSETNIGPITLSGVKQK